MANTDKKPQDEINSAEKTIQNKSSVKDYQMIHDEQNIESPESDTAALADIENSSKSSQIGKKAVNKVGRKISDTATNKLSSVFKNAISNGKGNKIAKVKNVSKFGKAKMLVGGKIIIAALIIIWLIGIISALVYIPALMKEGFVQGIINIAKSATTYAKGAKGKVYKKDIYKLGDYARSKGFQLYADGFIYEKAPESAAPADTRYIPEEGIAVNDEDKIVLLEYEGSPLRRYALMNAYTYTLENEQNQVLKAIGEVIGAIGDGIKNLSDILSGEERGISGGENFDGMIRLEESPWNPEKDANLSSEQIAAKVFEKNANLAGVHWYNDFKIKIDMEKKIMTIRPNWWFSNPYIFNIDGWAGRYGMPTEFLLALHKSVMAPDLIYELTNGTKIENNKYQKTKMIVRLIRAKGKIEGGIMVPNDTSINGKLYDSAGNEVDINSIDYQKVIDGEVIYYAKVGKQGQEKLFPLKTTEGPASIKLPTNYDTTDGTPKTEGEDDKYDITEMYINLSGRKVRSIAGYVVDAQEVKDYLSTFLNLNLLGGATDKAEGFILNFGLHNMVRRYNEEYGETSLAGFADVLEEAVNAITNKNYAAYMPLIYKVQDHWFRDVYFYMDEGEKYSLIDEDEYIKKGEYWTKFKGKNAEGTGEGKEKEVDYKETDKAWSAYKIEPREIEEGKLNYKTYKVDEEDEEVNEAIKKLQKLGDVVQIKEDFNVQVSQVEDGRRGETNKRTKELFAENKWYIYDGSEETANQINKRRKEKSGGDDNLKKKLTKDMDLLAGSLMLENMENIDAEYAYRDYKELLLELDYYTVDDLSARIRRVLQWPVPGASVGRTWPDQEGTKDETEFGVNILTKENTNKLIEKKLLDESGNPLEGDAKDKAEVEAKQAYGEGFEPVKDVVAPATGKITKQEDGKIEIQILNAKDEISQYKDFYEDEYKGGCAGYKITISNINVGIEDKSLYKPQIAKKDIEKLSTEEQRKKVTEKEQRKKDAPNLIGEYIKEGTVIGKTTDKDIKIFMSNLDDEVVEHVDKYIIVPYANFRAQIMEDYLTKIIEGEANQIADGDVDTFRKMFPKDQFPVINENAEAFLEMQSTYDVNAIFAAAVSLAESSGGTNFAAIPKEYNNIFSVTGSEGSSNEYYTGVGPSAPGSTNPRKWRKYPSVRESVMDFGKTIATSGLYHDKRVYVSEIGHMYISGSDSPNAESESWINAVNGFITSALKRYLNNEDKPSENNNQSGNNSNQNENTTPELNEKTEVYETNPFDLLGYQTRGTNTNEGFSFDGGGNFEVVDGVEYLNNTYYFNQCDPKYKPYNYGGYSISGTACGPFSSAIAFSAALGKPLDPIEIARFGASHGTVMPGGGSYWTLFPLLGKKFGVPVKETNSWDAADKALENGCVVIVSHSAGYWTNGGHFVTIVKKWPDGTYSVNDPASVKRSKERHSRQRTYGTAKNMWIIGPTESIKKMQAGGKPGGSGESMSARGAFEKLATEYALTSEEKAAWAYIIEHESSWNIKATNPSSGAYGLPQSLPGSKMAEEGADWKTNPETQLRWMYKYMNQRYGGILKAHKYWLNHKNY